MSTPRPPCGHPDWEWTGSLRRCLNPVCGLSFEPPTPPAELASGSTAPVGGPEPDYVWSLAYDSLRSILERAARQAESGKGHDRHARPGVPFEEQPIVTIGLELGSNHFELGQAIKKARESARLPRDAAIAELLGAINYLAGAVLVLERQADRRRSE